ncbi:MAG: nucleoside hydrolase [Saprospiraceae bacterium]|nr:nucleoside hydrolase [Saprospiraceae bacterium]
MTRILVLIFCIIFLNTYSYSDKAKFNVIVDTDCAIDDLRTISFLLASPDFNVVAITTTDGILHPKEGYVKVKALLNKLNRPDIPLAYGKQIHQNPSFCRDLCKNVDWGDEKNIEEPPRALATELIIKTINTEVNPVIVLCLSSLTNIQAVISNKSLNKKVKFLWYCGDYRNKNCMNYKMDSLAAEAFLNSNFQKYILSNNKEDDFVFDEVFYNKICEVNSIYTQAIKTSHSSNDVQNNIKSGFYELWDDLLPVFLLYPELFYEEENSNNTYSVIPIKGSGKAIKENILKKLKKFEIH